MGGSFRKIQEEEPDIALRIDRVGIKGVRRRVVIYTPEGELHFDTTIDAFVDLPVSKRGIHMSRNIEAFVEAIEQASRGKFQTLEDVLLAACRGLLNKHPYATRAEIISRTTYYYEEDFAGVSAPQPADVIIETMLDRDGEDVRVATVSIVGMTVCPSAQALYRERVGTELPHTPSHSQRVKLTLSVRAEKMFVRLERLINAARRAFSAPTVSLLKEEHEHLLIRHAFGRPRFIEDVVRHAMHNAFHALLDQKCPENTVICVEAESLESIHPHNAYAHRTATIRELMMEERGIREAATAA